MKTILQFLSDMVQTICLTILSLFTIYIVFFPITVPITMVIIILLLFM